MSEPPVLVGVIDGDNLVAWAGKTWRVPQSLGPLDIDNDSHRARPGISEYVGEIGAPAPQSQGWVPVRCVWWERTGEMTPFDEYGISSPIYRNMETGELKSTHELPTGALYWSAENKGVACGQDGLRVYCVCPGDHHWCIDGRASNCTQPGDKEHRCWIRHGTVGDKLTVNKSGGLTCDAGAGSISVPGWHGHLRNGELVIA